MDLNEISKLSEQMLSGLQQVSHKLALEKREDLIKNTEFINAKAKLNVQLANLEEVVKQANDTSTRT